MEFPKMKNDIQSKYYNSRRDEWLSENPVATLLLMWIGGIMIPTAVMVWWYLEGGIILPFLASFFVPFLSIAQGTWGILKYRLCYGEGPHPPAPSHGVVIVNPEDSCCETTNNNNEDEHPKLVLPKTLGCQCALGLRGTKCSTTPATVQEKEPPLRLLILGDSLAIGVGQSRMCCPVMPEAIAKTISKELGGRTVYWTCHGAPGASTGWIVRELEKGANHALEKKVSFDSPLISSTDVMKSWCSDTESSSSDESSANDDTFNPIRNKEETLWRERLTQHKNRFRPTEAFGPYDIVIVYSGSNDLKSACFPFLLTGEDSEFRREAQKRGGNYTNELNHLLGTLERKTRKRPLVVLPGLPARVLPVFRTVPLRWLSAPIVDIMDSHKRNLSKEHPNEVMFVPAPTIDQLVDYENEKGPYWEQRCQEDTAMALRDISKAECRSVSTAMREYAADKKPYPKSMPGASLFSADGIHPMDDGYDFWGRVIGTQVVDEYLRIQKAQ